MATDIIDKILAPSHTLYDKGSERSAQMGDLYFREVCNAC